MLIDNIILQPLRYLVLVGLPLDASGFFSTIYIEVYLSLGLEKIRGFLAVTIGITLWVVETISVFLSAVVSIRNLFSNILTYLVLLLSGEVGPLQSVDFIL